MGLSHIPTVQSILHKLNMGRLVDSENVFDECIQELDEVRNSWKVTALAVGGKPERSPEYNIAGDAITHLRALRLMWQNKYTATMAAEDDAG